MGQLGLATAAQCFLPADIAAAVQAAADRAAQAETGILAWHPTQLTDLEAAANYAVPQASFAAWAEPAEQMRAR